MFQALVGGQRRSGADMLSLFGAELPDGKGPRWAQLWLSQLDLLNRAAFELLPEPCPSAAP